MYKKRAYIVYHGTDCDGWFSAAIIENYLSMHKEEYVLIGLHGMDYSDACQDDLEKELETLGFNPKAKSNVIFMTDFTCTEEFMNKWAPVIRHFDHHISRLEPRASWRDKLLEDSSAVYFPGREPNDKDPHSLISSTEIVYLEFLQPVLNRVVMPITIMTVGRHDVWDLHYSDELLHTGLYELIRNYKSDRLFKEDMIESGFLREYLGLTFDECVDIREKAKLLTKVRNNDNYLKAKERMTFRTIETEEGPMKLGFINDMLPSDFFKAYMKEDQDLKLTIFFWLDINGRLSITCKSVRDNAPALSTLTKVVDESGMLPHKISLGGHKAACGGVFSINAFAPLVNYLFSLPK